MIFKGGSIPSTHPIGAAFLLLFGGLNFAFGTGEVASNLANDGSTFSDQGLGEFIKEAVGEKKKAVGVITDASVDMLDAKSKMKSAGVAKSALPVAGAVSKTKHAVDVVVEKEDQPN